MTPTIGSLFDGIGGFPLAFERHGFKCLWSVEIDKDCRRVLNRHWPDVVKHGDVKDVGAHNLEPVDVITFGSPCQDLSIAGKRAGLDGTRSNLFYEAIRIVGELRPTFALWENVPGAYSANDGRDFAAVISAFRELGARDICWRTLDAQYFGVPQRRRRIFLIADFAGEHAGEILLESESVFRDSASRRQARPRLATDVATSLRSGGGNGRGYNLDAECGLVAGTLQGGGKRGQRLDAESAAGGHLVSTVARCLTSRNERIDVETENFVIKGAAIGGQSQHGPQYGEILDDGTCYTLNATEQHAVVSFDWQSGGDVRLNISTEGTSALQASQTPAVMSFAENQRGELYTSDIANSVTSGGGKPGQGYSAPLSNLGVRRLTPTECERLQGYPDSWTELDAEGRTIADSARYRMLGNSVAVPVVEWIAERMFPFAQQASDEHWALLQDDYSMGKRLP